MNDVVTTFPLLQLPINAVLNTFRTMEYLQIFGISSLSKKTKNLVESLKLKARKIEIGISDSFKITIFFSDYTVLVFQLYQVQNNELLQELETPETYHIQCRITTVTWKNSMSVKELLGHLRLIFHSSIDTLFLESNCKRFSLESIQKNVKDFELISLHIRSLKQNRRILSVFQPARILFGGEALVDGCVPQDILIHNFDDAYSVGVRLTLDDLLLTNSRFIHFSCPRLSLKILTQFLKLWVKGSNLRLESMSLRFGNTSRLVELFSGLKYQNAGFKRVRLFKSSGGKSIEKISGGHDIRRFDGTKATIRIFKISGSVYFDMYVWHDHCIIN